MAGMLPSDPRPWPLRRDEALSQTTMRHTIGMVTRRFRTAQLQVFRDYPEENATRQRAVTHKRHAIRHMDSLLAEFRRAVEAHGGYTHLAATAHEAVGLCDRQVAVLVSESLTRAS